MTPLTFSALGTAWFIELFGEVSAERRQVVYDDLSAFFASFEQRFSRFQSSSLVSQLNQTGHLESSDEDLIKMLELGQEFYRESAGTFNILLGNHLIARGYDGDYSFKAREVNTIVANPLTDLAIAPGQITLSAGSLDLGGIGKGYAIDLIAHKLRDLHHLPYFLINGGGDMYATSDDQLQPITIYLEHPTQPKTFLGTTTLIHQGFAASSPHKRRWKNGQTETHHIVSDKNELSADGSYVISPSATTADVLATCSLLLDTKEFDSLATQYKATYATYQLSTSNLISSPNFRVRLLI